MMFIFFMLGICSRCWCRVFVLCMSVCCGLFCVLSVNNVKVMFEYLLLMIGLIMLDGRLFILLLIFLCV